MPIVFLTALADLMCRFVLPFGLCAYFAHRWQLPWRTVCLGFLTWLTALPFIVVLLSLTATAFRSRLRPALPRRRHAAGTFAGRVHRLGRVHTNRVHWLASPMAASRRSCSGCRCYLSASRCSSRRNYCQHT